MSAPDPVREPVTVSVVIQMADLHVPDQPGRGVGGPLDVVAISWCEYLVTQLQRLTEPRGGDLLCVVQVERAGERAGHQYREGRYVAEADPTSEDGDSRG